MPWFERHGDEAQLGHCDSEGCGGQPTWRFEGGGVGSNYCSGCKERIRSTPPPGGISMEEAAAQNFGLTVDDL